MDLTCPQCNNIIKNSTLRLVQDSCGHKKCRGCLLNDEHECKLCVAENEAQNNSCIDRQDELQQNYSTNDLIVNDTDQVQVTEPIVQIQEDNQYIRLQNVQFEQVQIKEEIFVDNKTHIFKRPYTTCLIPSHITLDDDSCKYTCNICSRSFISKGYIKYHKYCANGGKKPYQCKNCPKSFINLSQLDIHELIHSNKKPFACDICKKSFRQRSKLTRHRLLHNDKKMYKCEDCDKSFKTKESLTSHIATHLSEKPFSCGVCNASFNNSSNYRKHLVIHTKEKPHMCDQCGKRFKLKWTLNIHKKIHSSVKPYRCTSCTKVFSYAKDLQRHELIHKDIKAYACGSCNVEFRRKDNLERHMRNLHPGEKICTIKKDIPITKSQYNQNSLKESNLHSILPSEVPFINNFQSNPVEIKQSSTNLTQEMNTPNKIQDVKDMPDNTPLLQRLDVVRDRPNAVTVIRAPPGISAKNREHRDNNDERKKEGTSEEKSVINAPLKLALKTNEFKNHYNIQSRNYVEPEQMSLLNSVTSLPNENQEIGERRTALTSYTVPKTSGIHYETSFEQEKHAIIKNIKFKLPAKYTNLSSKVNILNNVNTIPQSQMNNRSNELLNSNNLRELGNNLMQTQNIEDSFAEVRKGVDLIVLGQTEITAATSVIVNTSDVPEMSENVHWRRRTSQNLNAKLLD